MPSLSPNAIQRLFEGKEGYDCLKVKKDMEFKFIWTLNGKIFMRKDKDSAVHHINNKEDLHKMKSR